jgi:hypothetical protein
MKKLLNVDVDLTLQRRVKKKQFGRNGRQILQILAADAWFLQGKVSTRMSTNSFINSIHSPRSRGLILRENTPVGRFGAGLHCQNRLAAVDGICVSGGLANIFARLKFAGLLYIMRFCRQKSRLCITLRPSAAAE